MENKRYMHMKVNSCVVYDTMRMNLAFKKRKC